MKRVLWAGVLVLVIPGCERTSGELGDAGSASELACEGERLEGTQPFSRRVRGEFQFDLGQYPEYVSPARDALELDVYLPQGLVPNAPVILASQVFNGFHAQVGQLGATASGELRWGGIIDSRARGVTATVARDGIRATVTENFSQGFDDVIRSAESSGVLCPSGATPTPAILPSAKPIGPLSKPSLSMTVPLDPTSVRVDAATSSGVLAASARLAAKTCNLESFEAIDVEPVGLVPPNHDVELDFPELRDVLGRAVPGRVTLTALKTTATLPDLELQAAPEGAIASSCENVIVGDGALSIGSSSARARCEGEQEVLIALPDPGTASQVELSFAAPGRYEPGLTVALVRADGTFTRAARDRASTSVSLDVPPGAGPLWLAAHVEFAVNVPQYGPPVPAQAITLAGIRFQPPTPQALDCNWFLAADNCWKSVVAPAMACLPPVSERGTVAVGESTCTYASGTTVTFGSAYSDQSAPSAFAISSGSAECLRYQRGADRHGLTVTTSAGSYVQQSDGTTLSVTCPDGITRSTTLAALESCGEQTGLGLVFGDFLVPSAAAVRESSAPYNGIEYVMSPRPENPSGAPGDWQFTAFRCGHE